MDGVCSHLCTLLAHSSSGNGKSINGISGKVYSITCECACTCMCQVKVINVVVFFITPAKGTSSKEGEETEGE